MRRTIRLPRIWGALGAVAACLALALIPSAGAVTSNARASLTPVTFMDDFTTNGTDAGYIVAEEPNSYYNQAGIQLQYSPGTGSPATAEAVATGQQDFGEITTSELVTAVSQGEPIKAVAMIEGSDGFGVVTVPGITSPQQLVGKTVVEGNSLLGTIFTAWLNAQHINPSSVNLVNVSPSALDTSVTSGSAPACLCVSYSDRLRIIAAIGKTNFFPFTSEGLGFTGNVVITNANLIQSNPALVKRFVAATIKGWNFAYDDPNLAAGDLQGLIPNQSPLATAKTNVETLKIMRGIRFTKNQVGHPAGWISIKDIGNAVSQLKLEGVLSTAAPAAASLFTNAFIPPGPKVKPGNWPT